MYNHWTQQFEVGSGRITATSPNRRQWVTLSFWGRFVSLSKGWNFQSDPLPDRPRLAAPVYKVLYYRYIASQRTDGQSRAAAQRLGPAASNTSPSPPAGPTR